MLSLVHSRRDALVVFVALCMFLVVVVVVVCTGLTVVVVVEGGAVLRMISTRPKGRLAIPIVLLLKLLFALAILLKKSSLALAIICRELATKQHNANIIIMVNFIFALNLK